jgi:hypothetical protein
MLPRILLALMLTAPFAWAQYATIGPNGQIAPAGSTVIVVGNGTGPVLSTPSVTFGTAAGTAGISLADRAGISNNASAPSAVPSGPESSPVYGNTNLPNAGAQPVGESAAALAAPNNTGRLINDVGPSYYAGEGFVSDSPAGLRGAAAGGIGPASLGDIAAKYKSSRPQNIRTYTNADAQRLSDTINVRGANLNPVSAQSAPPTPAQTQVAQTQTYSGVTAPPATPQLSASARPSPAIREEATQNTQSSATASDREQGATTPQASEPSSSAQNNDQQTGNRLPASSTLLPLFGLLGIASGAIGVWLTRYRR